MLGKVLAFITVVTVSLHSFSGRRSLFISVFFDIGERYAMRPVVFGAISAIGLVDKFKTQHKITSLRNDITIISRQPSTKLISKVLLL